MMKEIDTEKYPKLNSKIAEWINKKICSWNDLSNMEYEEFVRLQHDELVIPEEFNFNDWPDYIATRKEEYQSVHIIMGIDDGHKHDAKKHNGEGYAWPAYKKYLRDDKKMSQGSIDTIDYYCNWIMERLNPDTRDSGPQKGLVMGSVQSGKTSNMIGLVTLAADNGFNFFIVLSGVIENLRRQTRNRFYTDLKKCGTYDWHILDFGSDNDHMSEMEKSGDEYNKKNDFILYDLKLNDRGGSNGMNKYVMVCLKNSTRLRNLIEWLHKDRDRASELKILLIDDEADQASINTNTVCEYDEGEDGIEDEKLFEEERSTINQYIIDLVNGLDENGNPSKTPFRAMNYISYTATPYANVLNETSGYSLYPSNFICSLPDSNEYFGLKAIWGSETDNENFPGLTDQIVRDIPSSEMKKIAEFNKGNNDGDLPDELKKSLAWFLCAAAILRNDPERKKPVSMLIHTTAKQIGHETVYNAIKKWMENTRGFMKCCKDVYEKEKNKFTYDNLKDGYKKYSRLEEVRKRGDFPEFDKIRDDIYNLCQNIIYFQLDEEKNLNFSDDGIYLCVDNCAADSLLDDKNASLRVKYPEGDELNKMKKAPVFIVIGGNTLSRGLTLEGLVCTYFAREVNQADTLMQMARWFGYRNGYELLQRVWMPESVDEKFELLRDIDEELKTNLDDFMTGDKSPSDFGIVIRSTSSIAKFTLTSANKSQNEIPCDVDYTGRSYEIRQFENSPEILNSNMNLVKKFFVDLGSPCKSDAVDNAYVWYDVDVDVIFSKFLEQYSICKKTIKNIDFDLFLNWIRTMNKEEEGKYTKWNVAIAGTGDKNPDGIWNYAGVEVGTVKRSQKLKSEYVEISSSIRSGRDILCDVKKNDLTEDQLEKFKEGKKSGLDLIPLRDDLGLHEYPLLLFYIIDGNKGDKQADGSSQYIRDKFPAFSIIVSGRHGDGRKHVTGRLPGNKQSGGVIF